MKKKCFLSAAFVISLLPMLFNQYGGLKGVQEITGLINFLSVLLFVVGVWAPFKREAVGKLLGALGVVGIVISEIYKFFTWHILNITGEMSFRNSIEFAFPEFYFGLVVSLAMVVVYFVIDRIVKEK